MIARKSFQLLCTLILLVTSIAPAEAKKGSKRKADSKKDEITGKDFEEMQPETEDDKEAAAGGMKKYRISDDAQEKRDKAFGSIDRMASDIRCSVCERAAGNLSSDARWKKAKTEEEWVQALEKFCGPDGVKAGFADGLVEMEGYTVAWVHAKRVFVLEKLEEPLKRYPDGQEQGADYDVIAQVNAVQKACKKAFEGYESEIAEWMVFRFKSHKGDELPASATFDKLCHEGGAPCKTKGGAKSKKQKKGSKAARGHEL